MLLERMGEDVTLERADGTTEVVPRALFHVASESDQTVMDVQTRFINQARYKGDQRTLTILWPKSADHDLMGAHVWVRGERYAVYAVPMSPSGAPTGYDMRVTATRSLYLHDAELGTATMQRDASGVWRETFTWSPMRVNLLRLSESVEDAERSAQLARTVLIELQPGTDATGISRFRVEGHEHTVTSVERAGETTVLGGVRVVERGGDG